MSLWRQVRHGFRSVVRRKIADDEIQEEVGHFLEEAADDLRARGATPAEARRTVRLRYGTAVGAWEEVRSAGWENAVGHVLADVRFGARLLRRSPGFTIVSVLTLGLGVGAATAIFSAASPVLFEPLGYPGGHRIYTITDRSPEGVPIAVTFGTYRELLERGRGFQTLAVIKRWQPALTGGVEPERLEGQQVTADYFRVLGVQPVLGPGFDRVDDWPGGPDVVILGDGLWRRRFGADSNIVGRSIRLDDRPHTVVGVMPRGFDNVTASPAEAWSLLRYDAALAGFDGREWGHHLDMIGRLRDGITADDARRDLNAIASNPIAAWPRPPWAALSNGLSIRSLKDAVTADARPALIALLGAAGLVLIIAGVNVTNLLLGWGARRRGELTMRAVLGAGSGRLVRQLLAEGLLLSALGGMLGIAVAQLGITALVRLSPAALPGARAVTLDGSAFAFALGVTTLMGLVVGLSPALGARHRNLYGVAVASRRHGGSHRTPQRLLVVAQVALALTLLVGAGLVFRSVLRLAAVAPGFEAANRVVMQIQSTGLRFADEDAVHRFFAQSLEAVRQLPGVQTATLTSQLPLSGELDRYGVRLEDDPRPDGRFESYRYAVSPGYFETMGIPLLRGRALDVRDSRDAPRAVVIGESLARTAWPGRDPLGQRVQAGRVDSPWYTIVGVVGDVKQASLHPGRAEAIYVTPEQWQFADDARWLVVRGETDPVALVPAIKRAVWSVDPDPPIVRIMTMSNIIVRTEAQRRFALMVLEAFALLALVLAAVGLYGVVSGSVTDRLHEIGVRSALGASRERIVALVVRQGMLLTAAGVIIGLGGAAVASETVTSLLFGISRLDPVTYVAVIGVVVLASAVACWIPAMRAARVDPARTLRDQ